MFPHSHRNAAFQERLAMTTIFHELLVSFEHFFMGSSSAFYWLYLLGAALFALTACLRETSKGASGLRQAAARVFDPKIFFHHSAVTDYGLIAINQIIIAVTATFGLVATVAVAEAGAGALKSLLGDSPHLVPGLGASIVFTLTAFMIADAAHFSFHWLEHRIPVLWELHKVHHSAEVLTPLTNIREHPIVNFIGPAYISFFPGLISAVFLYLYDKNVDAITLLGANALFVLYFTLLGGHLAHSQIWIMFPKALRVVFYSPALHLIHHSANPKHYDTNYGFVFSFWDRLCGTLYMPTQEDRDSLRFGVDPSDMAELRTVAQLYWTPLRNIFRMVRKAARPKMGEQAAKTAARA
jgi:sterol desaturase/sphingolipid hydroxylase (fatty acid hydroxylase superfamily)